MTALNKAQVDALFRREAVLFGTENGVPAFRVAALFGEGAAESTHKHKPGEFWNGYGVGDYTLMYLTYRGFQAAASFYNVQQLRDDVIEVHDYRILPIFTEERRLEA